MGAAEITRIQFPEKLSGLFQPRRYKILYGGRGGAKSWGVARALLLQAADQPLRVLCAREVQKSMRDSVHRLLKDQIAAMGLGHFYEVLDTEIRGINGSIFLFAGLQSHTVDSIKSFEGVDRVWVEEAHGVSAKSWDVLIPTIRKEGSEIWATLNPDMDTDDTYQRFIAAPSHDTWLCEVAWRDNPWFPGVLEDERQKALRSLPIADYEHIWEGKPRRVAEGAIYRHEIDAVYADGRVRPVPYDPTLPVHTVWDLGCVTSAIVFIGHTPLRRLISRRAFHFKSSSMPSCRSIQPRNPASTSDHGLPLNLPIGHVGNRRGSFVHATISLPVWPASNSALRICAVT